MVFTSIPGIVPVDITSFGGKADGLDSSAAQNDTAFTNAYNAVVANGGGSILIPWGATGVYKTNTGWSIDADNVSLIGSGTRVGSPTIQIASTKDPTYALICGKTKNINNCLIFGLNFQGLANSTSAGGGIQFRSIGGSIKQCRIANFGGYGMNIAAVTSTIFEDYLEDVTLIQNGRNTGTPLDNLFIANTVTDFECVRVASYGDAAKSTTRHAINCAGGPGKFFACHEYFANQHGINITGNGKINIVGGEHETNGVNGITIAANYVTVNGATFFGNNSGDDISTANNCTIVNNTFLSTNNGVYATFATGVIADNNFIGQGAAPIWLDTSCANMQVHDNYIQNGDPGIKINGTNHNIHDNNILVGGIAEVTGANNNDIHDNQIAAGKTITIIGAGTRVRNNVGFNPVGSVSTPGFPATTVAATNTTGMDVTAFISNGINAITQVQVAGAGGTYVNTNFNIAASGWATIRIPAGGGIKFTYAGGAPAWVWMGD